MGTGFENCEVGFGKKLNWEMGLVPPPPFRTLYNRLVEDSIWVWKMPEFLNTDDKITVTGYLVWFSLEQNLKWAKQKVQALGVWFSTEDIESVALNYFEKKAKLNAVLNTWQFRRLTLLGKILVIKSLAASQLVYILSPFPSSEKDLKEINQSLFSYIWDGRKDKIKRSEMINEYKHGGLKMLDIQTFNRDQKAKWIQKYLDWKSWQMETTFRCTLRQTWWKTVIFL